MDPDPRSLQKMQRHRATGETVLVIEDDPHVRRVLNLYLETSGYCVLTAGNGGEGLDRFRENQGIIRVTITDMRMKGMQGTEVIAELRKINAHARIVVASGLSNIHELISEEPGRLVFVRKPMSKNELIAAVHTLIATA